MSYSKKDIALIGYGKIGKAIHKLLRNTCNPFLYNIRVADVNAVEGVIKLDVSNEIELKMCMQNADAVICATPYYVMPKVAKAAADLGIAYFDLTEDRESTEYVKSLRSTSVLVPQCGLAPGAVSIIASHLASKFDSVNSIDIRVGALPQAPNNVMGYNLTWSTAGLLNEYCHPCELIIDGKRTTAQPLDGHEMINLFGTSYEAFNTSGGLGSLCETYEGKVQSVTYKTMRYPGHCHLMKFLLKDLNLKKNQDKFIALFDEEVPQTSQDVVLILVKVTGLKGGKLCEENYAKQIYGEKDLTAIQLTTSAGICGVVGSWFNSKWAKTSGFVTQEEIGWDSFAKSDMSKVYLPD